MKRTYRTTPNWMRIIAIICVLLLMAVFVIPVCTSCDDGLEEYTTQPTESVTEPTVEETTAPVETEPEWESLNLPQVPDYPEIETLVTIYDASDAADLSQNTMDACLELLETTPEEHPQYEDLVAIYTEAEQLNSQYFKLLSDHWSSREAFRPVMTEVWHYLHDQGFNSSVVAGIIGNMSAESGGCGYSDIEIYNWDNATGRSYYGICQWSVKYNPEIANADLDYQLKHLVDTLDYNFTHWGYNYSSRYGSKFRTEQFLSMTDPYEAAIAFAVCYERCASRHVEVRGPLAEKTYEYFTVLNSWPWPGPNPAE